jgi:hypothetical protein
MQNTTYQTAVGPYMGDILPVHIDMLFFYQDQTRKAESF